MPGKQVGNYAERVAVLDGCDVSKLDFDAIGRLFVASALTDLDLSTFEAGSDGHAVISKDTRIVIGFHPGPQPEICCACEIQSDGFIMCHGACCEIVLD